MQNFSAFNFGCRLNQAELSGWITELKEKGFHYVKNYSKADFIIVHTCTLTSKADADVRKFIRKLKRDYPALKIIVAGCMVETDLQFFKDNNVFLALNNVEKKDLTKIIFEKSENINTIEKKDDSLYLSRGFLKIADGCDFRCTYCIIPYVRGRAVSIPQKKIIKEFKLLLDKGYKEIVITGVNIGYYETEKGIKNGFLKLLEKLTKIEGEYYLRLTSLDPRFLNEELIDFLIDNNKIGAHFHISVQNGSKKILKNMGRYFPPEKYLMIMEKLKKKKDVLLSADYIVGFIGEDDKEFEEGYDFLKNSPLNYLHIFRYSPRKGTISYGKKHPPERDAKKRYDILKKFHNKRYNNFKKSFIGKKLRGVVIGAKKVLTENYIDVRVQENNLQKGGSVKVEIKEITDGKIIGKIKNL